ncbi:MAG: hypothetical protein WD431_25090 [Cyclobacteriaceae bacterium]
MLLSLFIFVQNLIIAQIIDIGNNRELFVDTYLIENLKEADLELQHPVDEGEVLQFDLPWEGAFSAYVTILQDGDIFRAYYRGLPAIGNDKFKEVTCYAESLDGINWTKPKLGIHSINGSTENNVIIVDEEITHNFSPFIDQNLNEPKTEKYKALAGKKKTGLFALVSLDGIHWEKKMEAAVIKEGNLDSQNVGFWSESENKYIAYYRTSDQGFRSVSRSTSDDFINWEAGKKMEFGEAPLEHLYTQQTSPYFRAPHIYLAIGARFMPNRKVISDQEAQKLGVDPKYYNDCSDAILMSSRGGNHYERQFMESYIRPGIGLQNWVSRSNYPALNVVQTGEKEMSVYVNQDYAQPSAHLRRYSMRLDGFSSLSAGYGGGEMLTKPFTFEGKVLELNYSTSAAGEILVEILDENGNKIPGYSKEECQPVIGNEISRTVYWNNSDDLSSLSGIPVRMRVYLKDADLFSFRFY